MYDGRYTIPRPVEWIKYGWTQHVVEVHLRWLKQKGKYVSKLFLIGLKIRHLIICYFCTYIFKAIFPQVTISELTTPHQLV